MAIIDLPDDDPEQQTSIVIMQQVQRRVSVSSLTDSAPIRDYFLSNPVSDFECMNVVDDLPTAHQTIFDHERSLKAEQILGIDHIDHVMNCLDRDDASDDESDHIYEEIMDV